MNSLSQLRPSQTRPRRRQPRQQKDKSVTDHLLTMLPKLDPSIGKKIIAVASRLKDESITNRLIAMLPNKELDPKIHDKIHKELKCGVGELAEKILKMKLPPDKQPPQEVLDILKNMLKNYQYSTPYKKIGRSGWG